MMHRVLITGAGGGIGRSLRETLRGIYPVLRLSDRVPIAPARDKEELDQTDIADMGAVEKMVAGVDGIVHLGGISGESTWEAILQGNIIGTYNVFEAARRAGVKRIVVATSNHAVGFYKRAQTIDDRVVVRPDSRYGVSKAFGEALASLYSDKHGIGGTAPTKSRCRLPLLRRGRTKVWATRRNESSCPTHPSFADASSARPGNRRRLAARPLGTQKTTARFSDARRPTFHVEQQLGSGSEKNHYRYLRERSLRITAGQKITPRD